MLGAAWTAFACQWLTVVAGWFIGTVPVSGVAAVGADHALYPAVVPMIAGLSLIRFPLNWYGLIAAVVFGAVLYVVSAVALDVGEVRSLARDALRRRVEQKVCELTD